MRNIILTAVIAGFIAGCAGRPVSEEEYAATVNSDRRVWPPYDPAQAFPDQIMDGESNSGRSGRGGGRGGGGGGRR